MTAIKMNKKTILIFKEWDIFGAKNAKIQNFHKTCWLDFSENLFRKTWKLASTMSFEIRKL